MHLVGHFVEVTRQGHFLSGENKPAEEVTSRWLAKLGGCLSWLGVRVLKGTRVGVFLVRALYFGRVSSP